MGSTLASVPCRWCGSDLKSANAAFCAECKGPVTLRAKLIYSANFFAKNLLLPAAIGLFTFILASRQQEVASTIASRQKLADGLIEYAKTYGDYHVATRQILLLSTSKSGAVPVVTLRDAVLKLDLALASLGSKLIPFEEFARRTEFYKNLADGQPSQIQQVWDDCFVFPYWIGSAATPPLFGEITKVMSECDDTSCPTSAAGRIFAITERIYHGACKDEKPQKTIDLVWFHHELRRIVIQSGIGKAGPYDLHI